MKLSRLNLTNDYLNQRLNVGLLGSLYTDVLLNQSVT